MSSDYSEVETAMDLLTMALLIKAKVVNVIIECV